MDDHVLRSLVRREVPEAAAAYVFGSRAAGQARPDSDLDLALLLPAAPAPRRWLGLHDALSRATGFDVNLFDLVRVSPVVQVEVLRTGRLLFSSDEECRVAFEMHALSNLQRLNEERAAVLAAFRRTRRAYAV